MALDDLLKTQEAMLAHRTAKNKPALAVLAMQEFYKKSTLAGQTADKDPAIAAALGQAIASAQRGYGLGGLGEAVDLYANQYQKTFKKSTLSDIAQTYEQAGFKDIPEEFRNYVTSNATMTYEQLVEAAKVEDDSGKEAKRALTAISMLEEQKFEGNLYAKLFASVTKRNLESLYAPEEA